MKKKIRNFVNNNTEFFNSTDILSARTLNKPLLQMFDTEEALSEYLSSTIKTLYHKKGNCIIPGYLEDFNNFKIGTINNKKYLRIPTGALIINEKPVFIKPNCEAFERELATAYGFNLHEYSNNINVSYKFEDGKLLYTVKVNYLSFDSNFTQEITGSDVFEVLENFDNEFSKFKLQNVYVDSNSLEPLLEFNNEKALYYSEENGFNMNSGVEICTIEEETVTSLLAKLVLNEIEFDNLHINDDNDKYHLTLDDSGLDIDVGSCDVNIKSNATNLNSTLDVTGATCLKNKLDVTCNATVGGTLTTTGATCLKNKLDVDGDTTLNSTLKIENSTDLTLTSYDTDPLTVGTKTGLNIGINNGEIQARNNGAASTLWLNYEGGDVAIGKEGSISNDGKSYNGTAAKATADKNGNDIADTYATKSEAIRVDKTLKDGNTKNDYYGMIVGGSKTDWVRTTELGIIPYINDRTNGSSKLGTPDYPFESVHSKNFYGDLSGKAATAGTADKLKSTQIPAKTNNVVTDLNNYVTPGFYHAIDNTTYTNAPIQNFTLQVIQLMEVYVFQIIYAYESSIIYTRSRIISTNGMVWTTWKKEFQKDDLKSPLPWGYNYLSEGYSKDLPYRKIGTGYFTYTDNVNWSFYSEIEMIHHDLYNVFERGTVFVSLRGRGGTINHNSVKYHSKNGGIANLSKTKINYKIDTANKRIYLEILAYCYGNYFAFLFRNSLTRVGDMLTAANDFWTFASNGTYGQSSTTMQAGVTSGYTEIPLSVVSVDKNGKDIADTYATKTELNKKRISNPTSDKKYYVIRNISANNPIQIMGSVSRLDTVDSVFNFTATGYSAQQMKIVGIWNNSNMHEQTWEPLPFKLFRQSDNTYNLWVEIPSHSVMNVVMTTYNGTDYDFVKSAFDDTGTEAPQEMSIKAHQDLDGNDIRAAYAAKSHTHEDKTNYAVTTMVGLGFTKGSYVSVRDFWAKLYETYGSNGVIQFNWVNARLALVGTELNSVPLDGGTLIYTANRAPSAWTNFSAIYYQGGSGNNVYHIKANIGTDETVGKEDWSIDRLVKPDELTNWNCANINYDDDPNDCAIGQWYSINTTLNSTNMPEVNGWASVITFAANNIASYKKQICFYSNNARLFTRSCIRGAWGTWKKVIQEDDLSSYAKLSGADFTGAVKATSFEATSARDKKKDIVPTTHINAVEEINDIDIVDFTFKNDETNRRRVGFIADDTSPVFSGENQRGFDINNTVGMLLKAVQELSKEIKELKENGIIPSRT